MKTILLSGLLAAGLYVNAQTVSTIDNLSLTVNSFWNGSDLTGGFTSGNLYFPNFYDTSWGYWLGGWAYSNQTDTTLQTSSITQQFYSRAGGGFNSSANFAVGTQGAIIRLTGTAAGKAMGGVYITNTTYAYNSMKLGDAFAKQFGGISGNDPDFFKLTIRKFLGGLLTTDSIEFFLADYRFSNNAQDYLVTGWQFVDLTSLGNCDSLLFTLRSSDNGAWGMNTPAFFCADNFITMDSPALAAAVNTLPVRVYPTLVHETIYIETGNYNNVQTEIFDMNGKRILTRQLPAGRQTLDVNGFTPGLYTICITTGNEQKFYKIIKQ